MLKRLASFIFIMVFMLTILSSVSCAQSTTIGPIGVWGNDENTIEYTTDGRILSEGNVMRYNVIDEGMLRIIRESSVSGDSELIVLYNMEPDGTMTMNGVVYFPLKPDK